MTTKEQIIARNLKEASDRVAQIFDRDNPKLRQRDYSFIMDRFDAIAGALVN